MLIVFISLVVNLVFKILVPFLPVSVRHVRNTS